GPEDAWGAVTRSREEDHVQVVFLDEPVEVDVNERKAGARSPMAEKPILDVLRLQRLAQERGVLQGKHAQAPGSVGSPPGMDFAQSLSVERVALNGRPGRTVSAERLFLQRLSRRKFQDGRHFSILLKHAIAADERVG